MLKSLADAETAFNGFSAPKSLDIIFRGRHDYAKRWQKCVEHISNYNDDVWKKFFGLSYYINVQGYTS